jgi:hypothetical protein
MPGGRDRRPDNVRFVQSAEEHVAREIQIDRPRFPGQRPTERGVPGGVGEATQIDGARGRAAERLLSCEKADEKCSS